MTTRDAIKLIERSGTKINKDKVLEAIKKINAKEFAFAKDSDSGYSLILVKLG